jgi:hypothetical protein
LQHFALQDSQNKDTTQPCGVNKAQCGTVSALTKLLKETKHVSSTSASVERGMVSLTIYLPNYEEMTVKVKADITILELINQCLVKHKSLGLRPSLEYNAIYKYEIRIHEGIALVPKLGKFDHLLCDIVRSFVYKLWTRRD